MSGKAQTTTTVQCLKNLEAKVGQGDCICIAAYVLKMDGTIEYHGSSMGMMEAAMITAVVNRRMMDSFKIEEKNPL